MDTKIKIFKGYAQQCNYNKATNCFYNSNELPELEDMVNDFCKGKKVINVLANTVDEMYHNNGGCNRIQIVYTVIYQEV